MAAAEYYSPGGLGAPSQPSPRHSPQPAAAHPSQQHLNPPYPISDAPPPYEEISSSHASVPRPTSSQNQYRPSSTSQYPDDKPPAPPVGRPQNGSPSLNAYANPQLRPSRESLAYSSAPYAQQPPPPTSQPAKTGHLRPDYNPNSAAAVDAAGRRPTSTPPKLHGILKNKHDASPYYEPSRSRSRSSSRDRHRRRRHHSRHHSNTNVNDGHKRYDSHQSDYAPPMPPRSSTQSYSSQPQQQQQKKGNSVKTFLGAGGGALIGDCIFPGLGTIGGAILGGLGGHEYGKRNKEIASAAASSSSSSRGLNEGRDRGNPRPRAYSNDDDYYYHEERRRGRKH